MKQRRIIIVLLWCMCLPMYGQFISPEESYPMARQPEYRQTDYQFNSVPVAFDNEHTMFVAANDLDAMNEYVSGPRRVVAPPEIGGEETPPETPGFNDQPIGDVPVLFMLLLAGIYALAVFARTRTRANK